MSSSILRCRVFPLLSDDWLASSLLQSVCGVGGASEVYILHWSVDLNIEVVNTHTHVSKVEARHPFDSFNGVS